MEKLVEAQKASKSVTFRLFTAQSLEKIKQRIAAENQRAAEEAKKSEEDADAQTTTSGRTRRPAAAAAADRKKKAAAAATRDYPNPALESGKKFPDKLGEFPRELYGQPIEDLDDFYNNKYVRALLSLISTPMYTAVVEIDICRLLLS